MVFGAFEHSVVVMDLVSGALSPVIETTFDFGGKRLALSDELDGLLAAAYHVHGLAFHSVQDQRELWRRKDIKKVQQIVLSRTGTVAYCGREGSPLAVIDLRTGDTIRNVRGTAALHDSRYDDVQFVDSRRPQVLGDACRPVFAVQRTSFAFTAVRFAPGAVVCSEAGGPVRCFDIATRAERWRYSPIHGVHVIRLGYREADKVVLGVEWPYQKGGPKRLLGWSAEDGAVRQSFSLGELVDCCFAMNGEVLITTDGRVLATATGPKAK